MMIFQPFCQAILVLRDLKQAPYPKVLEKLPLA